MTMNRPLPSPEILEALVVRAEMLARQKKAELEQRIYEREEKLVGVTVLSRYAKPFFYVALAVGAILWAWSATVRPVGDEMIYNTLTGSFCAPGACFD